MTTVSGKKASQNPKTANVADTEREFSRIKEGIKHNQAKIAEFLRQRVGPGDWQLTENNVELEDDGGTIDMVFASADGKKEKYILVDVSVPHLGVGQKYILPTQAKIFQKIREIPATRVKKAIIVVRKGTETLSLQTLKVRCPIIEIQLENIIKQAKPSKPSYPETKEKTFQEKASRATEDTNETGGKAERYNGQNREQSSRKPEESKDKGFSVLSEELLYALKEAVVHESISTTYKRSNKYIRRGLWHWIEREIMDPNVHFFLIILSSIYQSKTGEILSKRFRTIEAYTTNPENVINAVFSRENALAEEIKKNSERHKKALTKFLCCFSAQPPFDYLKSLFLKEFRSNGDGLKSRMAVYTTLEQLLARCGFEGEKEVNYPLEILDELKIFQGILCGNYENLRTDNASKKLKHLVPQVEWEPEDVYALRDQLAKALNLPALEFNLNAYLPQAFLQDAKNMAETRKEAFRQPSNTSRETRENKDTPNKFSHSERLNENREDNPAKMSRQERMAMQKQAKLERQLTKRSYDDEYMPKKHQQQEDIDMPMFSENGDVLTGEALSERNDRDRLIPTEMKDDEVKRILDDPYAFTQPTSTRKVKNLPIGEPEETEIQDCNKALEEAESDAILPIIDKKPLRERTKRSHYAEVDESRHRQFENYGGIEEDDPDVIRLSLAMARREEEKLDGSDQTADEDVIALNNRYNSNESSQVDDSLYDDAPPPTKSMVMQGYQPSRSNNSRGNNRRQPYYRNNQNNNRSSNRSSNNQSNGGRNRNNRSNSGNGGYRDKKHYNNRPNGNNNSFRRRPRIDNGGSNL